MPFMILNPPESTAKTFHKERCIFLQKNALSCKMPFPAEKCTFLQKNGVFGGHVGGNCRKSREGFRAQESRTLEQCQVWCRCKDFCASKTKEGALICTKRRSGYTPNTNPVHPGATPGNPFRERPCPGIYLVLIFCWRNLTRCELQGATKGGRQKEFDPFLFLFGHLLVAFAGASATLFVTFS